jgi:hypothetical protein
MCQHAETGAATPNLGRQKIRDGTLLKGWGWSCKETFSSQTLGPKIPFPNLALISWQFELQAMIACYKGCGYYLLFFLSLNR